MAISLFVERGIYMISQVIKKIMGKYNSQINIVYYFHYIYIYYVCIQLYSLYLTPHSIILHMMYCICFIHYM